MVTFSVGMTGEAGCVIQDTPGAMDATRRGSPAGKSAAAETARQPHPLCSSAVAHSARPRGGAADALFEAVPLPDEPVPPAGVLPLPEVPAAPPVPEADPPALEPDPLVPETFALLRA